MWPPLADRRKGSLMLIKVHVKDAVGTLILNRPEKRNALSRELIGDLRQGLDDLHLEKRVKAVVVTGAGAVFCAGMDLAEMLATSQTADAQAQWHEDALLYRDLIEAMLRFPKPLIAAVNGPAVAGGAGLALACDMVVAADNASLGLPEPRRGLIAGVVAPLLAFRAGGGVSGYLLMTGEVIGAEQARAWGLFHEIVKADLTWARATELGATCAKSAPEALQLTKRMLNETIGEQLWTQLAAGAAASAAARTTEAAGEGLRAFLEKREPRWP
jgi:methylglutaconyl-CoA hydratase